MRIDVEQMDSWIGGDVYETSGERIGKVDEVYFAGTEPVAIAITSGLAGRKHHAAALKGASVTFDGVRLAITADELVKLDGETLTEGEIAAIAQHDPRLVRLQPEQIEGARQREQRRKDAETAQAKAEALDAEAAARAAAETKAVAAAHDAAGTADTASHERAEAEKRAADAHTIADQLQTDSS